MSGHERYYASIEDRAAADLERVHASNRRALPAPPEQEPPPEVVLVRGDSITPEPITWLWEGWLATGKLHVLAGAPGTGKSTIAFALAAALTAGRWWPDGKRASVGSVLIWSGEDDPADTIMPRMLAAGADPARVFIVTATVDAGENRPFDPARDMEALRQQAARIGDIRLLIADPIVSAVAGDSHKNTEVRRALQPLVDLGAMLGCAVLGISHFSKGSAGRDPTERVTGSIAFAALARIVLATAKGEGDGPRILARAKSNIGPDGGGMTYTIGLIDVPGFPGVTASRIEWREPVEGSARELLGTAEEVADADDSEDVVEWLRELLAGGVTPAKAVQADARECGFTAKQLRRAKEALGVVARKGAGEGPTAPWYWSLPHHAKMPPDDQHAQDAQTPSVGTLGTLSES
jgi:putative DNA primase/helicase